MRFWGVIKMIRANITLFDMRNIMLCSIGLWICMIWDAALSYMFYLGNPAYFIVNEANREFVSFLTEGSIPWINIVLILMVPFALTYGILSVNLIIKNLQGKWKKTALSAKKGLYGIIFSVCLLRFFAPLSWYDTYFVIPDIMNSVVFFMQRLIMGMLYGCIIVWLLLIGVWCYSDYKKKKMGVKTV